MKNAQFTKNTGKSDRTDSDKLTAHDPVNGKSTPTAPLHVMGSIGRLGDAMSECMAMLSAWLVRSHHVLLRYGLVQYSTV